MESSKFLQVLKVPMSFLKISGLWKVEGVKAKFKVLQFCAHLLLCEIFLLLQLMYLFTANNIDDIADLLSALLTFAAFSIKSMHFLKERIGIVALIDEASELAKLLETKDKTSLQALNRRSIQIQKTFKKFLTSGLIAMFMMAAETIFTNVINPNHKLPFKFWFASECQNNVYCLSFMASYQIIIVALASGIVVSLDILPIFFFNIGAGLLEELGYKLGRICDEEKDEKKDGKTKKIRRNDLVELEKCIAIHIKIKRFIKNAEKRFTMVILAQGSMSIFILCTVVLQLSKVNFIDF
jgi:7tm Odorant receptor